MNEQERINSMLKARDAMRERIINDPDFALQYAAETGDISLAKMNIEKSLADVNYVDEAGFTPLFRAVMQNRIEFVSFILDMGANPNIQTHEGFTPLMAAAESNNLEMLEILLENRADPDIRSMHGATSLHIAASLGHSSVIKMLLKSGADPMIRDNTNIKKILEQQSGQEIIPVSGDETVLKHGLTALDVAKMCGQKEAEKILKNCK